MGQPGRKEAIKFPQTGFLQNKKNGTIQQNRFVFYYREPDLSQKGLIRDQIILLFPYRGSSFIVPSDCMIRTMAGSAMATGSS